MSFSKKSQRVAPFHHPSICQLSTLERTKLCHHPILSSVLRKSFQLAKRGSWRDALDDDLGHFDSLLGNKYERVKELEHVHQLFHHQRYRNIERRSGTASTIWSYGVPLKLLLRPGQGRHPVRPRPAGLFVEEAEELRLGCGGVPDRGRAVHLAPPHTGPGCPLAPWSGMVPRFSQGHGDGHPLKKETLEWKLVLLSLWLFWRQFDECVCPHEISDAMSHCD